MVANLKKTVLFIGVVVFPVITIITVAREIEEHKKY